MVKACIERLHDGTIIIKCKRAKYKHWHDLGKHSETDAAFEQALSGGLISWHPEIIDKSALFSNSRKKNAQKFW